MAHYADEQNDKQGCTDYDWCVHNHSIKDARKCLKYAKDNNCPR
jgi:hypothetical protein